MAKTEKKTAKATKGTDKTAKKAIKPRVKRTPEEIAALRAQKLADLEAKEAARQEKLKARREKLEALLHKTEDRAQKKAEKDAVKNAKKEARELKKLEKREYRAKRLLELEAERQAKIAARAVSTGTSASKRGAGFKSGPEGKDSIGEFIMRTIKDSALTVEQLQTALNEYYGPSEKSAQWARTVSTYFNSLRNAYPAKLKLAKRGLFAVYDEDAKTLMVRNIKPKEQSDIFGKMLTFKVEREAARAKKIEEAKATMERINALRNAEPASNDASSSVNQ